MIKEPGSARKKGNDGNCLMGCWELGGENERRGLNMGEDENPVEEILFLIFRNVSSFSS
jgi:hypothetical protein